MTGAADWAAFALGNEPLAKAAAGGPLTAQTLRAVFPDWWFRETPGNCIALRTGVCAEFPAGDPRRGLVRTFVTARDLDTLAVQVACQEWLRTLSITELQRVRRLSDAVLS